MELWPYVTPSLQSMGCNYRHRNGYTKYVKAAISAINNQNTNFLIIYFFGLALETQPKLFIKHIDQIEHQI